MRPKRILGLILISVFSLFLSRQSLFAAVPAVRVQLPQNVQQEKFAWQPLHMERLSDGRWVGSFSMDDYLKGVLAGEMPLSWPKETLKAQIIAARTYLYYKRQSLSSRSRKYDVDSTVLDQVFAHSRKIPAAYRDKLEQVLSETKNLILVEASRKAFPTFYHADCGGQTESPNNVWGQSQAGSSVKDVCTANGISSWNYQIARSELERILRLQLIRSPRSELVRLASAERTPSGRVKELVAAWSDGGLSRFSAEELRAMIGYNRLKSTSFEISETRGGEVVFAGRGHGHGVGLCQKGSRQLALNGMSFDQILKVYYPEAQLVSLSETIQEVAQTREPINSEKF